MNVLYLIRGKLNLDVSYSELFPDMHSSEWSHTQLHDFFFHFIFVEITLVVHVIKFCNPHSREFDFLYIFVL